MACLLIIFWDIFIFFNWIFIFFISYTLTIYFVIYEYPCWVILTCMYMPIFKSAASPTPFHIPLLSHTKAVLFQASHSRLLLGNLNFRFLHPFNCNLHSQHGSMSMTLYVDDSPVYGYISAAKQSSLVCCSYSSHFKNWRAPPWEILVSSALSIKCSWWLFLKVEISSRLYFTQ